MTDRSYSLLALTQAASFYKLTRPRIVQENVIRIKGGRYFNANSNALSFSYVLQSYSPRNDRLVICPKRYLADGWN